MKRHGAAGSSLTRWLIMSKSKLFYTTGNGLVIWINQREFYRNTVVKLNTSFTTWKKETGLNLTRRWFADNFPNYFHHPNSIKIPYSRFAGGLGVCLHFPGSSGCMESWPNYTF